MLRLAFALYRRPLEAGSSGAGTGRAKRPGLWERPGRFAASGAHVHARRVCFGVYVDEPGMGVITLVSPVVVVAVVAGVVTVASGD